MTQRLGGRDQSTMLDLRARYEASRAIYKNYELH